MSASASSTNSEAPGPPTLMDTTCKGRQRGRRLGAAACALAGRGVRSRGARPHGPPGAGPRERPAEAAAAAAASTHHLHGGVDRRLEPLQLHQTLVPGVHQLGLWKRAEGPKNVVHPHPHTLAGHAHHARPIAHRANGARHVGAVAVKVVLPGEAVVRLAAAADLSLYKVRVGAVQAGVGDAEQHLRASHRASSSS